MCTRILYFASSCCWLLLHFPTEGKGREGRRREGRGASFSPLSWFVEAAQRKFQRPLDVMSKMEEGRKEEEEELGGRGLSKIIKLSTETFLLVESVSFSPVHLKRLPLSPFASPFSAVY